MNVSWKETAQECLKDQPKLIILTESEKFTDIWTKLIEIAAYVMFD
jgi:hypothetical protein